MNFIKRGLASIVLIGTSFSTSVFAIDLYVDTETKQIYTEPGEGRVHLGTFKKDDSASHVQHSSASTESSQPAKSNSATVTLDEKGVNFKSADDNFKFKIGGRLHADASFSNDDDFFNSAGERVEANDGTEIRRARLLFKANFFKDWAYVAQIDFADNKVGIKDMNLAYKGLGFMDIRVGSQKQAFSREQQESSNDLLFIERSVAAAITNPTVDRALGLNLFAYNKASTAQVGIYGDTIDANKRKTFADEGWAVSSRITHAPLLDLEQNRIINIGVNGNYREPNDAGDINDKPLKLATETTHMSNLKLVNASINNVDRIFMVGGDATAVMGPLSFGGEYTHMWIDRTQGESTLSFKGWFAEAAWTLTGESRNFKKGEFYRIKPNNNFSFSKGHWGAWEVAFRYGQVDLNDSGFKGGEQDNITFALNWYVNPNVRLMANYMRVLDVKDSPYATRKGGNPDGTNSFLFRSQLAF